MASVTVDGATIAIATDRLTAQVRTEGYVSGVAAGTLCDKQTGATDLGFGLDIVDFLLEPLPDEPGGTDEPYHRGDLYHGDLVKRYVELPQICTQARKLEFRVHDQGDTIVVEQWHRWSQASYGREPGSLWEQTLVFRDGLRYFLAADRVTSVNDVANLTLRLDMPGHLKHSAGDGFERIFLSYQGEIPSAEFVADFPPDARFLYQRDEAALPEQMIRAYQVRLGGQPGPWLAGITLDPGVVSEAWCHQRGYVCFIEEIGGKDVRRGEQFGAAYAVGWFDDIAQMQQTTDAHRGVRGLRMAGNRVMME
ncbi:MAG: hypothetical protein KKI08_05540 [Armatimonadetes bacterium]|nr:hypothetical protein [Armatimonadota bacterium]